MFCEDTPKVSEEKGLDVMLLLLRDNHSELCDSKPHPGGLRVPAAQVRPAAVRCSVHKCAASCLFFCGSEFTISRLLLPGDAPGRPVDPAPCRGVSGVAAGSQNWLHNIRILPKVMVPVDILTSQAKGLPRIYPHQQVVLSDLTFPNLVGANGISLLF